MTNATNARHNDKRDAIVARIIAEATGSEEEAVDTITDELSKFERIAQKISQTPGPVETSDIPAGATYLAQFVVHDLDLKSRENTSGAKALDLALIYGDGPDHDAFCYQVPDDAAGSRYLLRVGRTRPTQSSPAWGAARDLPRTACPHLDKHDVDTRSEVLVPNTFSDSNMLLGQIQMVWVLLHNSVASGLKKTRDAGTAFDLARSVTQGIYRDVIINDVFGTWLLPELRAHFDGTAEVPEGRGTDREFIAGVARIGHHLVREIYSLNDRLPVAGLRNLVRHTSTGRPHNMPLTEDWLVEFSRFFVIGSSVPQKARALGPHIARPFAFAEHIRELKPHQRRKIDQLVLKDLEACTNGDLAPVAELLDDAAKRYPGSLEGRFGGGDWSGAISGWLKGAGLDSAAIDDLAENPPLTLYLMLEAEHDAGGKSLGALGSLIMGQTLAAALPGTDTSADVEAARAEVFQDPVPQSMAGILLHLQAHYKFSDGARIVASRHMPSGTPPSSDPTPGVTKMLDAHTPKQDAIPRIEVADYIEMGKLVAQWTQDEGSRPKDVADLKRQLHGIAEVPDRIKNIEFHQASLDTFVFRLPVPEMLEESENNALDPDLAGGYPLPQFYEDFYRPGFSPVLTPYDMLMARVGDYTIAQCR